MSQLPVTRMYKIRGEHFEWARIWITDDGCFTCLSDYGNYGYWWTNTGCEFRKFLCQCDDGYVLGKLAAGENELDGEATEKNIKATILRLRRQTDLSAYEARVEWELVRSGFSGFDSVIECHEWYQQTQLEDASELIRYRPPIQAQMFVERLWPRFIEQLRAELQAESSASVAL